MLELERAWWPEARVEAALVAVGRHAGLLREPVEVAPCSGSRIELERRFDRAAEILGLGSSVEDLCFGEYLEAMARGGASLLHVPGRGLLVIAGRRGRALVLLDRDGHPVVVGAGTLLLHLAACQRPDDVREVEALLAAAGVAPRRRPAASQRMLVQRIGRHSLGMLWGVRLHGGAPLGRRLREAGVVRLLGCLVLAYLLQHGLFLAAWGLIGLGALEGRVEPAWLVAWALLLLTQVPLRVAVAWLWGTMTLRAGVILKQRFMAGALRLRRQEICAEGVGRLLGRVLESDALENAALVATFSAISAVVELGLALAVVAASAAAWPNVVLLVAWIAVTIALGVRYVRGSRRWTEARLEVTDQVVERMLGHETRVFQQSRAYWHAGEDEPLAAYLAASRRLDEARVLPECVAPRGWLLVGLVASMTVVLGGDPLPSHEVALVLGGVLLAYRALATAVDAFVDVAPAVSAWRQVQVVFEAGARRGGASAASFAPGSLVEDPAEPVLAARGLVFAHRAGTPAVLHGCDLEVRERDRIVMCGRSGAGKSSLAALLTGLATPDAGTVLCRGVDRATTGDRAWRWSVLGVCQFHDNHVFNASLAFNLLMGRRWPPHDRDWEDAKHVCRALGLGPLLDKMPAGIMQVVGQTGWQLSHGERSRLFVARALLQDPDLLVLDESIGALDPETAHACLRELDRRSRALVVIAHL